jgi:Na+/proline symporter
MDITTLQWLIMIAFGVTFFLVAPKAKTVAEFFKAKSGKGKEPNVFLLSSSLVIAWIFAKSIVNAANLGLAYGMVGGLSYAAYYLSFLVGGIVIYKMRVNGKFESIHQFLRTKYGMSAVTVFSLLIAFRLFNEVWSNTMVIGSFFGEHGSYGYNAAVIVFTLLTLAYTVKGGMRSSLITDSIQMVFFAVLLFILLVFILPKSEASARDYLSSGEWTMAGGLSLMFAVFIQILSYPFHDPVLTDRGFISSPKVTIKSYVLASIVGFFSILLFSFIGIFAKFKGLEGQATVEVSKLLGVAVMLMMNLIMITSAASTIDSTFSSFSKLIVIDLNKRFLNSVGKGRLAMILVAFLGTIPVFFGADILSASTISGTMVIGLAPVFLFWNKPMPSISFQLSVWTGVAVGILLATGKTPSALIWFDGKYGDLLSLNLWGSILCFSLFFLPLLFTRRDLTKLSHGKESIAVTNTDLIDKKTVYESSQSN